MQLVKVTKKDISTIQSLASVVWPHTYATILPKDHIAYMMDMMYSTASLEKQIDELGHHYLIVEIEGEYVGYLSYEINYDSKQITKIHKIYILPSTQGRGVGRFFIDAVENIAKENDNNTLSLNVNRYNKALDFYKRLGFEIVGVEDIDIGNGFVMEDYILNKIL